MASGSASSPGRGRGNGQRRASGASRSPRRTPWLVLHYNNRQRSVFLPQQSLVVGRSQALVSEGGLQIDNRMISLRHCKFTYDATAKPARVYILDSSSNGTSLRGTALTKNERTLVHNGDELVLSVRSNAVKMRIELPAPPRVLNWPRARMPVRPLQQASSSTVVTVPSSSSSSSLLSSPSPAASSSLSSSDGDGDGDGADDSSDDSDDEDTRHSSGCSPAVAKAAPPGLQLAIQENQANRQQLARRCEARRGPSPPPRFQRWDVHVGNLPLSMTEPEFRKLVAPVAPESVRFVMGDAGPRGFAFLSYSTRRVRDWAVKEIVKWPPLPDGRRLRASASVETLDAGVVLKHDGRRRDRPERRSASDAGSRDDDDVDEREEDDNDDAGDSDGGLGGSSNAMTRKHKRQQVASSQRKRARKQDVSRSADEESDALFLSLPPRATPSRPPQPRKRSRASVDATHGKSNVIEVIDSDDEAVRSPKRRKTVVSQRLRAVPARKPGNAAPSKDSAESGRGRSSSHATKHVRVETRQEDAECGDAEPRDGAKAGHDEAERLRIDGHDEAERLRNDGHDEAERLRNDRRRVSKHVLRYSPVRSPLASAPTVMPTACPAPGAGVVPAASVIPPPNVAPALPSTPPAPASSAAPVAAATMHAASTPVPVPAALALPKLVAEQHKLVLDKQNRDHVEEEQQELQLKAIQMLHRQEMSLDQELAYEVDAEFLARDESLHCFRNAIPSVSATLSQPHSLSVQQLLLSYGTPPDQLLLTSMVLDPSWLRETLPLVPTRIVVAPGQPMLPGAQIHDLCTVTEAGGFAFPGRGIFHIKLILAVFPSHLRVAVTSANLRRAEWEDLGQVIWVQDFPVIRAGNVMPAESRHDHSFRADLTLLLVRLGLLPELEVDDLLRRVSFENARGILVASLPGQYRAADAQFGSGLPSLCRAMQAAVPDTASLASPLSVYMLCSSLGNLRKWWLDVLAKGLVSASASNSVPDVNVVYPSIASLQLTGEIQAHWLRAGLEILFFRNEFYEATSFCRDVLRDVLQTDPERFGLQEHSKVIALTTSNAEVAGLYLGSHNLSVSAWGHLRGPVNDKQVQVFNYELGIVPLGHTKQQLKKVVPFAIPAPTYADTGGAQGNDNGPYVIEN